MKNVKILHKRGDRAPLPDEVDVGEVAMNTAAGELYVKKDDNEVVVIGGSGGGFGNLDGGHASSIYTSGQVIDGGSA